MPSDTLSEYVDRVREFLNESSSSGFWTDTKLQNWFNASYRKRMSQLTMSFEGYVVNTTRIPVLANENFYEWPAGFERVQKLEIVRSNGATVPMQRYERHTQVNYPNAVTLEYYVPTYRPFDNGFKIEPTPNSGFGDSTLLEGCESDPAFDSSWLTGTAGTLSRNETNARVGSASIQVDKDGSDSQVFVEREASTNWDVSGYNTVAIDVYLPDTLDLLQVQFNLQDSATQGRGWTFTNDNLNPGWNTLSCTVEEPDYTLTSDLADTSSVPEFVVVFTYQAAAITKTGLLVDNFRGQPEEDYMILEWVGFPPKLTSTDRLHPSFPVSFDELLVLDTVCIAFDSEGLLENGIPRAIELARNEWTMNWERYIDSRTISRQRIMPLITHYEDA